MCTADVRDNVCISFVALGQLLDAPPSSNRSPYVQLQLRYLILTYPSRALPNDLNFNGQKAAAFLGGAIVTNSWVVNSVRIMFVVKVHNTDFLKCPESGVNFNRD